MPINTARKRRAVAGVRQLRPYNTPGAPSSEFTRAAAIGIYLPSAHPGAGDHTSAKYPNESTSHRFPNTVSRGVGVLVETSAREP